MHVINALNSFKALMSRTSSSISPTTSKTCTAATKTGAAVVRIQTKAATVVTMTTSTLETTVKSEVEAERNQRYDSLYIV